MCPSVAIFLGQIDSWERHCWVAVTLCLTCWKRVSKAAALFPVPPAGHDEARRKHEQERGRGLVLAFKVKESTARFCTHGNYANGPMNNTAHRK